MSTMIGFVLGGLAAMAVMRVCWRLRHRRWHHWQHGHHCHHGRHGGAGWQFDDNPGFPSRMRARGPWVMRFLSDRLQTTPTQERAMTAAVDEFLGEVHTLESEGKQTRADLAAAMRKASFDEVLMGELYARHDNALEKLRKAFVGLAAKVHDTLDEEQRDRLAALIEQGPRFFRRGFGW
jgi:hypothetical protein